jgi:hypothetical protein
MNKCIKILPFAQSLFDQEDTARKAAKIMHGILKARSGRLTHISHQMDGNPAGNYKTIQRFIQQVDAKKALLRLFQEEAQFVIGDPTEMPRPEAKRTDYVGTLKDGSTRGYWLLKLATPYRGRAIPCWFITYSSKTINAQVTSRNQEHNRAFAGIKDLLEDRPLVLDREFSYLELLQNLVAEEVNYVIRLNTHKDALLFTDFDGTPIKLQVGVGKKIIYKDVYYKGVVKTNLIGVWRKGFARPLWVMTNMEPEDALTIYLQRMKIEESFKDIKDLLGVNKIMNKRQAYMEGMVALILLAYAIILLIGEAVRDQVYGPPPGSGHQVGKRWKLYSGGFIILRQKIPLSMRELRRLNINVLADFHNLLFGNVRTPVLT